jgi:hypothetical protein
MEMKSKESFKHKAAKLVLSNWLKSDYSVKIEETFENSGYPFRPDISCYTGGQLQAFYEVVHTSDPSGKTIGRMQMYCYMSDNPVMFYLVDAEYILKQCEKPDKIEKLTCELIKT